eukprot:scaffold565213_cov42-Prasinocladus_malaysianus.AAC.1
MLPDQLRLRRHDPGAQGLTVFSHPSHWQGKASAGYLTMSSVYHAAPETFVLFVVLHATVGDM